MLVISLPMTFDGEDESDFADHSSGMKEPFGFAPPMPLVGRRVVVTRPRAQSGDLEELLTRLGASIVSLPTIEIVDPPSIDDLDASLRDLSSGQYEWIVFLSANAVERVFIRLSTAGVDMHEALRAKVVAIGDATARELIAHGVTPDVVPEAFTSEDVAGAVGSGGGKMLVPRAMDAPARALDGLRANGWQVDEVVAYRTAVARPGPALETIKAREFDVVSFTSGSTARGLAAMVTPAEAGLTPDDANNRKVACIGPSTAQVAVDLGFRVDAVATQHSTDGLVQAVMSLSFLRS